MEVIELSGSPRQYFPEPRDAYNVARRWDTMREKAPMTEAPVSPHSMHRKSRKTIFPLSVYKQMIMKGFTVVELKSWRQCNYFHIFTMKIVAFKLEFISGCEIQVKMRYCIAFNYAIVSSDFSRKYEKMFSEGLIILNLPR